jgi:hypothetical protein
MIKFEGTVSEQAAAYLIKAKSNPIWAQSTIMQFIESQKERAV